MKFNKKMEILLEDIEGVLKTLKQENTLTNIESKIVSELLGEQISNSQNNNTVILREEKKHLLQPLRVCIS